MKIPEHKKGQTMLEILIAVTLGGILLGGAVTLIVGFMNSNKRSQEAQSAISLSNDLIEKARSVATENWSSFISLNKGASNHYNVSSTPPFPILSGDASSTVKGINFKQYFYIENVYRNTVGNIVASTTAGSVLDPSTIFVVVRITWNNTPQGGINLSEFLTRTRNEAFQQSDWSGGPGQEFFPSEGVNHKYFSSTNISATSTQGSLRVASISLGELTSSVFDSGSNGTVLNSILWQGTLGLVKFQIATSTNSAGPWNYFGCTSANDQSTCSLGNWFFPAGPNISHGIPSGLFNNIRYFRYKTSLDISGSMGTDGDGVITGDTLSNAATSIVKDSTYMYVGGYDTNVDWRFEKRLLTTGALDVGFGTGGIITDVAASANLKEIKIDSTYMYAVGYDTSTNWRIEKRLLTTGALDGAFGTAGVLTVTGGDVDVKIDIDSTHMYLAGKDDSANWRMEKRLLSTGALDAGFGTGGVISGVAASWSSKEITIDSTYMYVVGYDDTSNWRIEKRLLTTGALDVGFAVGGVYTSAVSSNQALSVEKNPTYMYVVGYDDTLVWRIEKLLLTTGALDAGFGTGGVITGVASTDIATDIAIDSTYMYVVGYDSSPNWRIEKRLLTTGALDVGFGTGGVITGVSITNAASAIIIDPTYLYVAGRDDNDWRFEKRFLSNGSLETTFGNDSAGLSSPIVDDVIINYSP